MINRKLANAYTRKAALKGAGIGITRVNNKIKHMEAQSEYTKKFLTKPVVQEPEPPKLEQWTPVKKKEPRKMATNSIQGNDTRTKPRRMFFGASIIKNGELWEVKSTHPEIHSAGNFKRREDARNYLRRCVDALIESKESNG